MSIARPNQVRPPGNWVYWVILAGRGTGKTRTGAEWVRERIKTHNYTNLIGATAADARDIMVLGESGLMNICRDSERPKYIKSERKLIWPNGAESAIFTADEPDRFRGHQHSGFWADERAAWRYDDSWTQAVFGLRIGEDVEAVVTTTPRPTQAVKELIDDPDSIVTVATTYENKANLHPKFYANVIKKYEGTRIGRQELMAEILDGNPNAMWKHETIDRFRAQKPRDLVRIVVGVDPQSGEGEDNTGIVVAGSDKDGHAYVLADYTTNGTPSQWGNVAVEAYHRHKASRIVAEVNQGGKMVEYVVRSIDRRVAYKGVHATQSKSIRAEPISALYEQGFVHHIGCFPLLEDEMTNWVPGDDSPDRMDALVYALSELMLGDPRSREGFAI